MIEKVEYTPTQHISTRTHKSSMMINGTNDTAVIKIKLNNDIETA